MKTELNNVSFYIVVFKRNIIFSSETFRKAELVDMHVDMQRLKDLYLILGQIRMILMAIAAVSNLSLIPELPILDQRILL